MNETMYVKPAPGVKVRDPFSRLHVPESGERVPANSYWLRRLDEGSVAVAPEPAEIAPEPAEIAPEVE